MERAKIYRCPLLLLRKWKALCALARARPLMRRAACIGRGTRIDFVREQETRGGFHCAGPEQQQRQFFNFTTGALFAHPPISARPIFRVHICSERVRSRSGRKSVQEKERERERGLLCFINLILFAVSLAMARRFHVHRPGQRSRLTLFCENFINEL